MKWIAAAVLGVIALVAVIATWQAFTSPAFWTGLVTILLPTLVALFIKPKSAEEYKRENADYRQRTDRDINGRERRR